METEPDSCNVCGGTDSKLIDGFYYCIECGTQNTNVRETILEEKALGDGTFAQSNKRKIVKVQEKGIEMSEEWYRWHAFNFIISGLADELVTLGAKPTFKMKLLWIWTRYIKKYQNKSELTMHKTTCDDNDQTELPTFMIEEEVNSEAEETQEELASSSKRRYRSDITDGSRRDIKFLSKGVILAMLYVALNLDGSEIQLSHLYRFLKDKQLNINNVDRFVPDDINIKKIPGWINFLRSKVCNTHYLRALAMSLLKKLNLGTPKVPDLRKIADNFLTELCLPNDMKLLVYSLMHFRKCEYLDVDDKAKITMMRIPDYENIVMTYVLVAIKMCFGLDCDYEVKLSDVIEKINEDKDLQRSYRIGKYSEPSDRLFSFREWCSYIQFRKIMLSKYNLRIAEKNGIDVDDYVYIEQMEDRPKYNEELPDKISMEIIARLPLEHPVGVIPKEMFLPTLTPLTDYTDIIIDHCQDPEVKLLLAEDFKRYSLKYACENLNLLDSNMDNIIKGVSEDKKTKSDIILGTIVTKKAKTQMVYVRNCENRNWLKTNPPTIEHVTCVEPENEENDKESDHGYDSENTSKEKDLDSVVGIIKTDENITDETAKEDKSANEIERREIITEEDENKNIFDDCFEDLDLKEECEKNNVDECDMNSDNADGNQINNNDFPDDDFDRRSNLSDDSFNPTFNPDTFDRERTIKELILCACKKYKIAIPAEYRTKEPRKRKENKFGTDGNIPVKRLRKAEYDGIITVKELLSNYYNYVQSDFVAKVQQEMSLSIRNSELQSLNDEQNNLSNANLQISVVERSYINENRNTAISENERNSTVGAVDQQNPDLDFTNKTDINNITNEIDENLEKTLFDEDEDMKLDDLVPKGDSEFDEKKYDIEQLYIKVKEEQGEISFDARDDPEIDKIIVKKIEECKHSAKYAMLKKQKPVHSDSEDEIPLSVIKEEAMLIDEQFRQEENYERLIKKEDTPEFKYWIRHYDPDFMLRSADWHTKFDEELNENTPTSFRFVIQECASILNCTNFYLYKNMQFLEEYLVCKAKNSKYKLKDTNDVC